MTFSKGTKLIHRVSNQAITVIDVALNVSYGCECVIYQIEGENNFRVRNINDFENFDVSYCE